MKNTVYFTIFSDIYGFMKKYYPPKDGEEYWQGLVRDSLVLHDKYKGSAQIEFVKALIFAVTDELEGSWREKKKLL